LVYILDIYAFIEKKKTKQNPPQIQPDLVNILTYAWKVIARVELERNFTRDNSISKYIYISVDAIFSRVWFRSGFPYRGLLLRLLNQKFHMVK